MAGNSARFADLTIAEFVDRLASAEPVPGGGSASAIAAGLGAALLTMVARLSIGRPKYEAFADTHTRAEATGTATAQRFLELADEDAAAYAAFAQALKLPRETAAQQESRSAAIRQAARGAASVPLDVVRGCHQLALDIEAMAGRSNLNAASDIGVAALLADAAAHGAAANVLINLPAVGDDAFAASTTNALVGHLEAVEDLARRAREVVGTARLREPESS
jgi:formiminotetrahydrofolate cyclodeaminase